jgi:hypothetical protein
MVPLLELSARFTAAVALMYARITAMNAGYRAWPADYQ